MMTASGSARRTTDYRTGDRVLLHRSANPEQAYVTEVHARETGTELVLNTTSAEGGPGQMVNVFAPFRGSRWVTPADQPMRVGGGAA